uniref:Uncharacterized protein n=1 Tax=Oryza sativa subsp. japonica TaxID=39947 RepID=Q7XI23_ORYSJ|nr:hypothetical protein [Oryza sativa Japonica Group]BAD30192.1 hypothetical protein [Oryza sativa Japonica Group]
MPQPKEEGGKIDLFFKRHDGPPVPSGRPGTARLLVGRAWAGGAAHGPARHGPVCWSGYAGPTDFGPSTAVSGPCRAGPPEWPTIPHIGRV